MAGGFALALLVSADAGAGTVLVADRAEPFLAAHLDLTGAQYANDLDGFSARMTVRDLTPRSTTLGFVLTFAKHTYRVAATRTKAGKQVHSVVRDRANGKTRLMCSQFTVTWDDTRDRIDVHVPWSCLGELRAPLKVQGSLDAGKAGTGTPDDLLKTVRVAYS